MGERSAAEAAANVDPEGEDQVRQDEARVVHADSQSPRAERAAVGVLLSRMTAALRDAAYLPSKWRTLIEQCLLANAIKPGGREQAVIFTEYADSAGWIANRLAADGYTARMYSGRQTHAERDEVRAAFMSGDFQIIVCTDAGNEGIDLQAAHVLVNFDIPWSLVRLEQRMGRVHRVGQTRDVELFNLVATETREGDTLHTLLENFVTAANELDGQMFDSLSLVAELAAVPYEEWLHTLYGDDELKKAEVLAAARRVSTVDLKRQAERARSLEAELSTAVDTMAGLVRLQQDSLEQIYPAVVEAYLRRLGTAGVLRAQHTAAGEGILVISADWPLPKMPGGTRQALVATSGKAMQSSALSTESSRTVPLSPGNPTFAQLVEAAGQILTPDVCRGGTVEDPTATNAYELYAFTSSLSSPAARETRPWSALIRVVLATSLSLLLPRGIHDLEAWNEAVCGGAWGKRLARTGERVRRAADLEHWAAFGTSFAGFERLLTGLATGAHGEQPASITVISGDVHHSYLAAVSFPPGTDSRSAVYQAVCSPIHNMLPRSSRRGQQLATSRAGELIGAALARIAGVPKPEIRWRITRGPWFHNMLSTLEYNGHKARIRFDRTAPAVAGTPRLQPVCETELS